VAWKRVSKKAPPELSPSDCLRFWGLQENGVTRGLFHFAENYERLLDGRIITVTLAKQWITNVYTSGGPNAAGEEFNQQNQTGTIECVSPQYLPLIFVETDTSNLFQDDANEQEFCGRIEQESDTWLSSRPSPEDHISLWHGTSMQSMNRILRSGIDQTNFQEIGDFSPGFYCVDKVRASLRLAILSGLAAGAGPLRASLIYFDVKIDDLNKLNKIELAARDDWAEFTGHCLSGYKRQDEFSFAGDRSALQLVKDKLVHNTHEVQVQGATAEEFEDGRMQYAFRGQAGGLLLEDKGKMGVALFDVCMP
jgi:hypothetical protein